MGEGPLHRLGVLAQPPQPIALLQGLRHGAVEQPRALPHGLEPLFQQARRLLRAGGRQLEQEEGRRIQRQLRAAEPVASSTAPGIVQPHHLGRAQAARGCGQEVAHDLQRRGGIGHRQESGGARRLDRLQLERRSA